MPKRVYEALHDGLGYPGYGDGATIVDVPKIDVGDMPYEDAMTLTVEITRTPRPQIASELGQLGLDQLGGTPEVVGCAD